MRRLTWWHCGLWGTVTLLAATVISIPTKMVAYIVQHPSADVSLRELPLFLLGISGMGFACGVIGWSVWLFARRLGTIGDAIIGVVVMVFFFFLCMVVFARDLLFPDPTKGLPMWILAVVVGIVLGVSCGKDFRK